MNCTTDCISDGTSDDVIIAEGKSVLRVSLTDGAKHALAGQIRVWNPG
jgi:hypothetical protein